jgi:1-acyl-sn-glycerol-3-phosphate acyltransferase
MTITTFPATETDTINAARPWADRVQRRLLLPLVRALFPLTIAGQRGLLALPTPCIFAADHGSHLDTLAILAALPDAVRTRVRVAAAADYWYRDPLRRLAVSALGGFPFPRKGILGLTRAAALLDSGQCILIYPEGTRGGGPFRPGVARLAAQAGVPVVPIAVRGGRALWPKGRALPRRGPLTVTFGAPLRIAPGTSSEEATRRIEAAVRALAATPAATVPVAA